MGRVRVAGMLLIAVLIVAGCGSSGSGTTGGGGSSTTAAHAMEAPLSSRGAKGEDPTAEAATGAHLSAADCEALAKLAQRSTGAPLQTTSTPKPPLSRCRMSGGGSQINVYLDAGFAANQRFHNRIEETVQFNGQHPEGLPQPVPHVGEKAAYNSSAQWIPALRSLLAVRGNRWLTVTISLAGQGDRAQLAEAAVLARAGFELTAKE